MLAGLLWAASLWHWVFWDLDLFRDRRSNKRAIDSPKLFGIHLTLAGLLCLSFGSFHTATFPGIWISDVFSVTGGVQPVEPDWSVRGFDAYSPGGIVAHHPARRFEIARSIRLRPYNALAFPEFLLRMGNIETVHRYGGGTIAGTEAIVQRSCSKAAMECEDGWLDVPDVLAFYDYVGHNPAKGGLFRVGAMNSGDGISIGWLGHPIFRTRTGQRLYPRRMPSFFESFPVILVDDNLSDELSPGMPWNAWAYR